MEKLSKHWTAESVENFTFRIASDFLAQIESQLETDGTNRSKIAQLIGRSKGRVSQLFNPGNITLGSDVRLCRALGMKVSLVAYNDKDPNNQNGPIDSEVFSKCWAKLGAPRTYFEFDAIAPIADFVCWERKAANVEILIDERTIRQVDRDAATRPVLN